MATNSVVRATGRLARARLFAHAGPSSYALSCSSTSRIRHAAGYSLFLSRAQHSSPASPSAFEPTEDRERSQAGRSSNVVEFPVDLLASLETEGRPDLKALDELIPHVDQRSHMRFDAAEQFKLWQKTMQKVLESFNVAQLKQLVHDARVPEEVLAKSARMAGKSRRTKDVLAGALLVHRFGIEDPKSREMEQKEKEEQIQGTIPLTLPTAYLLFTVKMDEFQSILQHHRVQIGPSQESTNDPQAHAICLFGRADGVEAVTRWMDSFASGIKTLTRPLTELTSSSREALEMPDSVLLRELSVASRSIVTLDDSDLMDPLVTISSIDIKWLRVACTLLVHRQQERHQLRNRAYLALTAPAVPVLQDAPFPMYSMQPHFASRQDSSESGLFRLARQDMAGGETSSLKWDASASGSTGDNTPILTKITDDDRQAEGLLESLAISLGEKPDRAAETVFSAQFGHLVFSHDSPPEGDPLGVLSSPLSGTWPVEKALGWLGEDLAVAHQSNILPNLAPSFVPCAPPSALDITTHDVRADDGFRRRAEQLDEDLQSILSGIGVPEVEPKSKLYGMLSNDKLFDESLLVQYTDGQKIVEIRLQKKPEETVTDRHDDDEDQFGIFDETENFDDLEFFTKKKQMKEDLPWTMNRIRQVRETQADVLVPDASVDIRFTASRMVEMEAGEMVEGEEWQAYTSELSKHSFPTLTAKHSQSIPLPPFHITVDGKQYSLVDQFVESKWTWEIVEDPSFNPFRTEVKYTLTHNIRSNAITPALRLQWLPRPTNEVEQDKRPLAPTWHNIRRALGAALSEGYGDGMKYSI